MDPYILIPDLNPVKYVKKDVADTDNIYLFDKYNYEHTVQRFEGYRDYTQKWVNKDLVRQQIWSSGVDICNIDLVDCNGVVIQNYPGNIALPNFIINGTSYNIIQFDTDTTLLATGRCFFIINYTVTGDANTYKLISEPQEIVAELKPSILLKYSNTVNEFNTIFKTSFGSFFEQHFYLRVEGRVVADKPNVVRQTYEDQILDLTQLNAKPFDTFKFKFGSGAGIPKWMGSKLNMAIACNTVSADNIQFTFLEELEEKNSGYYTRYLYEIVARYKEIKYVKQHFVPSEPGGIGPFTLPDGIETVAYSFIYSLSGMQPFSLGAITKPAWMTVIISGNKLIFGGTPANSDVGTNISVSVVVTNATGSITLADLIDVLAIAACVPVSFTLLPKLPSAVAGQPYLASIPLAGTAPYILSSVVKPAWATVSASLTGIDISGTPTVPAADVEFSFDISNCGGGPANTINFSQFINVTSGIIITGTTSFDLATASGSGNIIAIPGTLVTVNIEAQGIAGETFTLDTAIVGAGVTGSTNVTNGLTTYTFVMPAMGNVAWSATYTATDPAGSGSISVS